MPKKAYAELQEYHIRSTKASLSSVKILGYITSTKIGHGACHGTAENFILNWQEQVRLPVVISQMNKSSPCFRLLTAVNPLQELCQVKAAAALLKLHTQKDLDYDAYSSLLLSTASDYDSKYAANKGKKANICT
jgi:hypothetical protein